MVRLGSIIAILLPVIVGVFILNKKHLLLKVPKIGFVLHAIAGGPVPPYMDMEIYAHQDEWLGSGDVIISVPAKCGTNWMMYTLHLLRSKGEPEPFRDIYEEVPWCELVYYPGQSMEERINHLKNVTKKYPMKVYKSHASPLNFKVRDDVKYVVVLRNLFDAAASLRTFFGNHRKDFAEFWGGFPPGAGSDDVLPDADWEDLILKDSGSGRPMLDVMWLDHIKAWWPYRKRSNVLFLHYSERVKDDTTQITRLANFLDIKLTPAGVQNIVKLTSFEEMKHIQALTEMLHALDTYKARGLIPNDILFLRRTDGSLLNKGPERHGENELSDKMRKSISQVVLRDFPPKVGTWLMNGGELPDVELY